LEKTGDITSVVLKSPRLISAVILLASIGILGFILMQSQPSTTSTSSDSGSIPFIGIGATIAIVLASMVVSYVVRAKVGAQVDQ